MPRKKEDLNELEQFSVDELKEMKGEIKNLLATLEDDYRKASITEKSYKEVKKKNNAKLKKITEILYNMGITDESEAAVEVSAPKSPSPQPEAMPAKPQASQSSPPTGTSKSTPPTESAPPVVMQAVSGISETKFTAEMEKLKILIDTIKEAKTAADEKLLRLTEGLGEIRSLVYQREGIAKEQDVTLKKLEEEVSELKPERIAKEFVVRDKNLSSHDMKIEKLEFKTSDLIKNLGDIRALLKSIGGLENIASVNKEIAEKLYAVKDKAKYISRLSDKIENIFVDLNKKMEDFSLYRAKQETTDELVKELMKTTDNISVELKDFVTNTDLAELKEDIAAVGSGLESLKRLIDVLIPIVKLKIPEKIQDLQKEREDVETLLFSLEDTYRSGKIDQKGFRETKKRNQTKLKIIQKKLRQEWERFDAAEKLKTSPPPQNTTPTKPEASPSKEPEEKPAEEKKETGKDEPPKEEPKKESQEQSSVKEIPPEEKPAEDKTEEPKESKEEPQEKPTEEPPTGKTAEPAEKTEQPKQAKSKMDELSVLQESLDSGLISKKAFEQVKKALKSREKK